jgi:hypothetical protein
MLEPKWNCSPRRKVRISVDGAQSTGKTTLVEYLKGFYKDHFVYIPEASREIAPSFGVHNSLDWAELIRDPERLRCFFDREEQWLTEQEPRSMLF